MNPLILFFEQISDKYYDLVGGKAFSLGKLQSLSSYNIKVPEGFVLTTEFYRAFLDLTGIKKQVYDIFKTIDITKIFDMEQKAEEIRALFFQAKFPDELRCLVIKSFRELKARFRDDFMAAVRSSATTEDLEVASFAGQFDTFLCVREEDELIGRIRGCLAGLFNARAISYRVGRKIPEESVLLGIIVQRMVRADKGGASGVMFSLDTETGFDKVVYINSIYGFGELLVGGKVNPDQFYVFKPTLLQGKRPVIDKKCGLKQEKLIYDGGLVREQVPVFDREQFSISDEEALELARQCIIIEETYGRYVDVEWVKDENGIYIVQARPETIHAKKEASENEIYELKQEGEIILTGEPVGAKIGSGKARVVLDKKDIIHFQKGEVLVTTMTDPDMEPQMKIASAVVTERGGRTCHAAIICRELGIPCIIGTGNATQVINTGDEITVDCSSGTGRVFKGLLKYNCQKIPVKKDQTHTKIMMNVGTPEKAFQHCRIPNDGVGLARIEFIISSAIGIHPLALVNFQELKEKAISSDDPRIADTVIKIEQRAKGYTDKTHFFINTLARGISRIAAAFWPNDVIVRLSDFKTNEYGSLIGGFLYEPNESNPMIGWRGASRYYDPKFKPAFALECFAIKKARDEFGLTNIKVMIPFCRTPEEGRKVIKTMVEFGLRQGENDLEVYVMCEIPSNVILAEEFAEIFDGFSIGSNDLTQLTLGLDRDSELVAHIYDERNAAVKALLREVVEKVHKKGKKIGICGQAPSDFPDFAEFLVECGIDSISLNPDTVLKTRQIIAKKEAQHNS